MTNENEIFNIKNSKDFNRIALKTFRFQSQNNKVYQQFLKYLKINPDNIQSVEKIPFLPIQFFKDYQVVSTQPPFDLVFKSSGTTGTKRSKHFIKKRSLYEQSFMRAFSYFYGDITDYNILALLPSYFNQGDSSLIYMTKHLITKSAQKNSNFYLNNTDKLAKILQNLDEKGEKTLLLGVSYALMDLIEKHQFSLKNTIVMETGGMKGRRKEMVREELHNYLTEGFGVPVIHSEYGMTELLTQSYSQGKGIFKSPAWKKIYIRDTEDPLTLLPYHKTGGVNIIDLANLYSCSFIATQDLGKIYPDGSFEILGRFDHSDVRGCNLLIFQN